MRLKLLALSLAMVLFGMMPLTASAVQFNPFGSVCSDKNAAGSPTCTQNKTQNGKSNNPLVDIIHTAADIIAAVAGVAAVVIILISGFMFVTAGGASPGQRAGDPERIKKARTALFGALIGLVIIALAWTIVTFVTDNFIG